MSCQWGAISARGSVVPERMLESWSGVAVGVDRIGPIVERGGPVVRGWVGRESGLIGGGAAKRGGG